MLCPRRQEINIPHNYPSEDEWIDNCCSYCGSLSPDVLLELMRNEDVTLGPTYKNYKMYVSVDKKKEHKFYFMHFNQEQQMEFIDLINGLNTTNSRLKIGYPGHFYVLPYFCMRGGQNGTDSD